MTMLPPYATYVSTGGPRPPRVPWLVALAVAIAWAYAIAEAV